VIQSLDPGNLKTNLQRTFSDEMGRIANFLLRFMLHPAINGAYTELFAGFAPEVTLETSSDPAMWGESPSLRVCLRHTCRSHPVDRG
jgi:retinol dehydrogenase 12